MHRIATVLVWAIASSVILAQTAIAQRAPSVFDHVGLARQVLERHIIPGYERLARTTQELADATHAYCRKASPDHRRSVDRAFDAVVTAWGRIEHITFGPVTAEKRLERIMFWPDRRGIGARQLAKVLRTRDPATIDAERLAEKSVAIQGLPALDAILFGQRDSAAEAPDTASYRCALAVAISTNLSRIAASIETDWTRTNGFAHSWLAPGPGSRHFLKPSETTLALAKALDRGLEMVRDQRIGGPMGLNAQRRRIPPVLARSDRTLRLVAANIEGLREFYVEGGIEAAILAAAGPRAESSAPQLARLVSKELAVAHKGASELIGTPLPFENARSQQRLIALGYPLKNARQTASELLAEAAGIPTGFNASDGD